MGRRGAPTGRLFEAIGRAEGAIGDRRGGKGRRNSYAYGEKSY